MTRNQILRRLQSAFRRHLGVSASVTQSLVPPTVTAGKLYEAHVLGRLVERLADDEGYSLTLVGGSILRFKSAPGPINRHYPRIEVSRHGTCIAEIWTDVEFMAMSYSLRPYAGKPSKGDYHELDIVMVDPGQSGRPRHDSLWLGVECKNTGYQKGLLKEILGIRRELSFLQSSEATKFRVWPRDTVPARPPSCLLVFSTDEAVLEYAAPGEIFGIDFIHEPM